MKRANALPLGGAKQARIRIAGSLSFLLRATSACVAAGAYVLLPQAGHAAASSAERPSPDYLGTVALKVSHTPFDGAWKRVSAASSLPASAKSVVQSAKNGSFQQRAKMINAWVNHHIQYAEDSATYRQADFWASSRETLRREKGDCEDIAIVKRDLLIAAGVPSSTIFMTIAKDLVRHADHALLIVDTGTGGILLDDSTDDLLDAQRPYDYRPIITLGKEGKWLHGYARGARSRSAEE